MQTQQYHKREPIRQLTAADITIHFRFMNTKPSHFYIIYFICVILVHIVSGKCRAGQWPSNQDNLLLAQETCHECPPGFECNGLDIPKQCPPGTRALGSSAKCCQRNLKCPPGFAVDNDECSCVSLGCPKGMSLMQSQFRLQCQVTNVQCKPCIGKSMVQNENCQCFYVKVCGQGSTFWKYGANYFEC